MEAFAEVMLTNPVLQEVYLYDNDIGNIACKAMARVRLELVGAQCLAP